VLAWLIVEEGLGSRDEGRGSGTAGANLIISGLGLI